MKKHISIIICYLSILLPQQSKATIHAYFTDLFAKEPVPTEFNCYKVLCEHPVLGVHYVAVPWTIVMKEKMLSKVPPLKLEGGFTICQHFKYEDILPLLRNMGVTVLFTPHARTDKTYPGITVVPIPFYAKNSAQPASEKNILYSFVGTESSQKVRKRIFKLPRPSDVVIIKRKTWGAYSSNTPETKEYKDILARSRFALCPRGYGAGTIRFWEALQAGAIPVVLADNLDLPHEIDWNECCIRIRENEVSTIDAVLRSIPYEREAEMRAHCLAAYQLYSDDNIVYPILAYYQAL